MVFPLIDSIRLSFFASTETGQAIFVGFDNFVKLITDSLYSVRFWSALKNNVVFFIINMIVQNTWVAAGILTGNKGFW
jgi:raffinose/stachyose/melibiose transport system permease protein